MSLSKKHPRYTSLLLRNKLIYGVKIGITSLAGLTAHGRGEAFDYLLRERTHSFADEALVAAAAFLISANHPVISVNGNTAALVYKELIQLALLLGAPLEVNLFHASRKREYLIKKWLQKYGADEILIAGRTFSINSVASNRKYVSENGILSADVVFAPLEDGDRAEKLIELGKKVVTIDLNPLSRTAKKSTVTIVDNIVRSMPLLIKKIRSIKNNSTFSTFKIISNYNNQKILQKAEEMIRSPLM